MWRLISSISSSFLTKDLAPVVDVGVVGLSEVACCVVVLGGLDVVAGCVLLTCRLVASDDASVVELGIAVVMVVAAAAAVVVDVGVAVVVATAAVALLPDAAAAGVLLVALTTTAGVVESVTGWQCTANSVTDNNTIAEMPNLLADVDERVNVSQMHSRALLR